MTLTAGLPSRETVAAATARALLEIGAVLLADSEPFTLTSGRKSPVYVDCRKVIAYPRVRRAITEFMAATVLRDIGYERIDAVAGGETAGIAYAAWLAEALGLPMLYVRKKPKGFGRMAQIEGAMAEGTRVLLVEDLATDGGSKLAFCNALRDAGGVVTDTMVAFHYAIFPEGEKTLAEHGVRLHGLTTWWDVYRAAADSGHFAAETLREVRRFLDAPHDWAPSEG